MIIDIEIKIADDNGITLKHYRKRLDGDGDKTIRLEDITGTEVSFKELLDRYLSHSGRKIREKLLPSAKQYGRKFCAAASFKKFEKLETKRQELVRQTPAQAVCKYEASFHTWEEEEAVHDKSS